MANLKDIRDRIKSVKSIQKVTKAMKMVAAAKMRRAQERMEEARPYAQRLQSVIGHLLPDVDRELLNLLCIRPVKRTAYVVVTSDRGLAGSFNSHVLKKAQSEIDKIGKERVDLFCIGKKARDHFKGRDYKIIESHLDFWNDLSFGDAIQIGKGIISHFTDGNVDEIHVVYNEFVIDPEHDCDSETFYADISLSEIYTDPDQDDLLFNWFKGDELVCGDDFKTFNESGNQKP